jgi:hypothetical protein
MTDAGAILKDFYHAVKKRDLAAAQEYLDKDLLFVGISSLR